MTFNLKTYKYIGKLVLKIGLPFILFSVLGLFMIPHFYALAREIVAFFLLTSIGFCITFLFTKSKISTIITDLLFFFLSLIAFIKLSFYAIFKVKISASALFVFFETNVNEASEFLSSYFNVSLLVVSISFIVVIAIYVLKLRPLKILNAKASLLQYIVVLGIAACSLFLLYTKGKEQSLIFNISKSYKEYKAAKADLKKDLAQPKSNAITDVISDNSPEIGVIIIGESTTRWHMELYGYVRKTNPLLTEIKDELSVFNNVISPSVMTIESLEKVLTMKTLDNPKPKSNFSVVQLANAANYTTHWISNQQPVGFTESIPTLIGQAANHKKFLATDDYVYTIYDEALLPELEHTLKTAKGKQLIFIHLIGAHRVYNKRYPDKFKVFKEPVENQFSDRASTFINDYDNAVLYNDFIVRSVIETVRKTQKDSFVMYFSDHGDDVFDTQNFVGHFGGNRASKPMFDIPFILWTSNKTNPFSKAQLNTPYLLDDFPHSFSELINTTFKGFKPEKSIFNTNFKPKKRQLTKTLDYDAWN